MRKWFLISLFFVAILACSPGCVTNGGQNWQNNVPQAKADIFMFSKLATRVVLVESNVMVGDVKIIEGYLVALRDILSEPGSPDFTGARLLVGERLPQKYRIYGFTIIDIIERYIQTSDINITDDHELIAEIISSGIDGALEAVLEFSTQ